jgi:hypothetical protein
MFVSTPIQKPSELQLDSAPPLPLSQQWRELCPMNLIKIWLPVLPSQDLSYANDLPKSLQDVRSAMMKARFMPPATTQDPVLSGSPQAHTMPAPHL